MTVADRSAEELLRERIARTVSDRRDPWRRVWRGGGQTRLPMDARSDRRHEVVHSWRAAVHDAGRGAREWRAADRRDSRAGARRNGVCGEGRRLLVHCAAGEPSRRRRAFRRSRRLGESLLLTSEVDSFSTHREKDARDVFLKLQRAARLARTWGDGYGYLHGRHRPGRSDDRPGR